MKDRQTPLVECEPIQICCTFCCTFSTLVKCEKGTRSARKNNRHCDTKNSVRLLSEGTLPLRLDHGNVEESNNRIIEIQGIKVLQIRGQSFPSHSTQSWEVEHRDWIAPQLNLQLKHSSKNAYRSAFRNNCGQSTLWPLRTHEDVL